MIVPFPSNTTEVIEEIINEIGRNVEFVQVTYSACPYSGDSLDPVTNTSTNSFCPICSGEWWIPTWSGTYIKAHVTWKFADDVRWDTGGITFLGDGIVKIMYTDANMTVLENTDYAVVDGKQVEFEKITLLGVPQVNRIQIDFKERKKSDD